MMNQTEMDEGIISVTWIETYTGKRIDFENPDPASIDFADISHALARISRFCGHTSCANIWSVALHSLVVERYLAENDGEARLRLLGLLHDAHEAYVGDRGSPQKGFLPKHVEWENALQRAIWEALEIAPPTAEEAHLVKYADLISLATEADSFMPSGGRGWNIGADPQPNLLWHLDGMAPNEAAILFTRTLGHLLDEVRRWR